MPPILANTRIDRGGPGAAASSSCNWQAPPARARRRGSFLLRAPPRGDSSCCGDDQQAGKAQSACPGCKHPSQLFGATPASPLRTRRQCTAGGRCTGGGAPEQDWGGLGTRLPVVLLQPPKASLKGRAAHGTSKRRQPGAGGARSTPARPSQRGAWRAAGAGMRSVETHWAELKRMPPRLISTL